MRPKVIRRFDEGPIRRTKVLIFGADCGCGKVAYTSWKVAAEHAARLRRQTGETIEPYHCKPGHCWHVGHPIGLHSRRRAS